MLSKPPSARLPNGSKVMFFDQCGNNWKHFAAATVVMSCKARKRPYWHLIQIGSTGKLATVRRCQLIRNR